MAKEETKWDPTVNELAKVIIAGWPADRSSWPHILLPYSNFRKVGIQDDVLLKRNKVILQQLHASQKGIKKTKLRTKTVVYWVRINQDINDMVTISPKCQKHQPSLWTDTLLQHETLSYFCQYISTDLFSIESNSYLFIADQFTKSLFVRHLYSTTSTAVIKQLFEERGVPEIVQWQQTPIYK